MCTCVVWIFVFVLGTCTFSRSQFFPYSSFVRMTLVRYRSSFVARSWEPNQGRSQKTILKRISTHMLNTVKCLVYSCLCGTNYDTQSLTKNSPELNLNNQICTFFNKRVVFQRMSHIRSQEGEYFPHTTTGGEQRYV